MSDILRLNDQYRLVVQSNPTVPFLEVYAQAPDVRSATALADAAVDSVKSYLGRRRVWHERLARTRSGWFNSAVPKGASSIMGSSGVLPCWHLP